MEPAPSTLHVSVREPWFTALASRRKVYEGRLGRPPYSKLRPGQIIVFRRFYASSIHTQHPAPLISHLAHREPCQSSNDTFKAVVTSISQFASFRHMLEGLPLEQVLPGVATVDEGVAIYSRFYSAEDQARHTVIAIGIKVADESCVLLIWPLSVAPLIVVSSARGDERCWDAFRVHHVVVGA